MVLCHQAVLEEWTVDKPATFGDWLWEVFVVQLAARLDRLTLRDVIAFIPVLILIFAYLHRIPIPPELMLVGDLLAYIDVFAMTFLLSMMGRAGMVLYAMKRIVERTFRRANTVLDALRRFNFRHRRATSAPRRDVGGRTKNEDDGCVPIDVCNVRLQSNRDRGEPAAGPAMSAISEGGSTVLSMLMVTPTGIMTPGGRR